MIPSRPSHTPPEDDRDDAVTQLSRLLARLDVEHPDREPTRADCLDALDLAIALLDRFRPHEDNIQHAWAVLHYLRAVLRDVPKSS